jgi:hypothetical protein
MHIRQKARTMASPAAGNIVNLSRKVVRKSLTNTQKRWKSTTPNVEKHAVEQQHQTTQWPTSFQGFLRRGPLITCRLPLLGSFKIDFGTAMMNIGALKPLTGFMMTDVLLLRTLSIFGSLCRVVYNVTCVPRQWNAVPVFKAAFDAINESIVKLAVQSFEKSATQKYLQYRQQQQRQAVNA